MMFIVLDVLPPILKEIPYSTLFILGIAALISLLTTYVNVLFQTHGKSKEARKEISEWNKELRGAQRAKDKKTIEKLMKKQQYIMQMQTKMMWNSMKVSLLFLVPLLIMWQLLNGFFTDPSGPIAIAIFLESVPIFLCLFSVRLLSGGTFFVRCSSDDFFTRIRANRGERVGW